MIAIGKIVIQMSSLAEQSSTRGTSVSIDHLFLHCIFDEIALVICSVVLRQEFRRLFRSTIRTIYLAQFHHGQVASLVLLVSSAVISRNHAWVGPSMHTYLIVPCTQLHCDTPGCSAARAILYTADVYTHAH